MQTIRLVDKTRSVSFTFYPSHIKFKCTSFSLSLPSRSSIFKYQKRRRRRKKELSSLKKENISTLSFVSGK